ncbi:MAG: protein kinase [Planctomycetota bacterium]
MSACPSQVDLQRYVEGRMLSDQGRELEQHLVACDHCRAERDHFRADEEVAARLRTAFRSRTLRAPVDTPLEPEPSLPPTHAIPGYTIQQEIARGGMGVVYKAVQESTHRTVALKVMLEGPFASPSARQRFQREVELAAALEHPNIVPIFDSGRHGDHHYFAMQYVDGVPLNRHLETNALPISERLKLFLQICAAVNYAHQRGVIHRDLKPSNVMVAGQGHVHVLDFGLAKIIASVRPEAANGAPVKSSAEARHALVSITGQILGTLPYMSPEQVSGVPLDIDVRADVYALGVILFEMLTGDFPYDVGESLSQTLRNITDAPPRSPTALTKNRPADQRIDRELEAIVLKTLSKSKEHRYQSVGELAADLERYLKGEAVEARRNSRLYILRKTLSRHRPYVAAVVLVFVAACTAALVSFRMYVQMVELNRSHARAAGLEAELALSQGLHREALEKAEQALQLDPHLSEAQLLRANTLLLMDRRDEAKAYLEHLLEVDPQSWAAHYALAEVDAADPEKARFHQQRVLALRPNTAEAYYASSIATPDDEALEWLSKALACNPMHYESRVRRARLYMRSHRWDAALADAEVAMRVRPGDFQGWWWRGEVLLRYREYAAAIQLFNEAIKLKPTNAGLYYPRATAYRRLREYHKAIEDYSVALKLGPANTGGPWLPYHRATLYWIVGDYEAALSDYDRFGELHPAPFWSDARRYLILQALNRDEEAQSHLEQAYARTPPTDWLGCVFELLLGRRSPEDLLALADTDEKRCEATYYIAERKLLEGDREGARQSYEACLATGVDRYIIPGEITPSSEYELSEWRRATLFAGPSP